MTLIKIHKDVSPDIAAAKSHDKLSGMHLDMACHHNHITDYSADPTAFYFPFPAGSTAANRTLPDHSQDVVCNQAQFQDKGIGVKLPGRKTFRSISVLISL